jgi:hypothetical protein
MAAQPHANACPGVVDDRRSSTVKPPQVGNAAQSQLPIAAGARSYPEPLASKTKRTLKRWSVASRLIKQLRLARGAVISTGSEGVCEHLLMMNANLRLAVVCWVPSDQPAGRRHRLRRLSERFPQRLNLIEHSSGPEFGAFGDRFDFLLIDGSWGQQTSQAEILDWSAKVENGGYLLGFVSDPAALLAVTRTIGNLVADFEISNYSVWKARLER